MWLYIPSVCAAVEEVSILDLTLPAPEPSHLSCTLNMKPMQPASWQRVWKKEAFIRRLSGLTFTLSQAQNAAITFAKRQVVEASNLSTEESPVSLIPSPVSSVARMIRETYGPALFDLLRRVHQFALCSSRTSLGCYRQAEPAVLSKTWSDWVSVVRSACLRRRKLVLPINESGCSSWPTWQTPQGRDYKGLNTGFQEMLANQAATFPSSLPAPLTEPPGQESSPGGPDSRPLWTTPQAHDVTERGSGQKPCTAAGNACLARDARAGTKKRLNPNFVDWLMGYPIGHSDCDSTVTPSSLSMWRRLSSLCLRHWLEAVTKIEKGHFF